MQIKALLKQALTQLTAISSTPELDAEWLLAHVLNISRAQLRTRYEQKISPPLQEQYFKLLQRRLEGEPVAYILGEWEFWSLPLKVTRDTLIPRPETELLVELILQKFSKHDFLKLADLGTGSGAIALALARERPQWQITATDQNPNTLAVAQYNAQKLNIGNIAFCQGDWCEALPEKNYDVIVSNPPYIRNGDDCLTKDGIRFEPQSALASGRDGLQDLQKIIRQAPACLKPSGWIFLEHGYDQAASVCELLKSAGFAEIITFKDLAGLDRVSAGRTC